MKRLFITRLELEKSAKKTLDAHKRNNTGAEDKNFSDEVTNDIKDCFHRGLKTEIDLKN